MEVLKDRYSITELSQRLNVTDHALRYYEKEFRIAIPKDERGRRYYTPELANIMYQIKAMRSEGLEIKAIRKILLSESVIAEPPPVVAGDGSTSVISNNYGYASRDIKAFFEEFREQITESVSAEIASAHEMLTLEINKSKLELGACVENSIRKLETKMEKHFQEVDEALGNWRRRSKKGFWGKLINK